MPPTDLFKALVDIAARNPQNPADRRLFPPITRWFAGDYGFEFDQGQCQLTLSVNHYGGSQDGLCLSRSSVSAVIKKYTFYFFKSSVPNVHSFASPTQEFPSLDEARIFAQNAAEASLIETARSFRIQSEDGSVNEHWSRRSDGWKLEA